jgi:hypothetical protein
MVMVGSESSEAEPVGNMLMLEVGIVVMEVVPVGVVGSRVTVLVGPAAEGVVDVVAAWRASRLGRAVVRVRRATRGAV